MLGVVGVYYQLNGTGWNLATTTNGNTNWTASVTLVTGVNTIQAFAKDAAGNFSLTNTVKCTYSVPGVLAPTSLAGYAAKAKPSGGGPIIALTWGDGTWAQTGSGNDTNADDYCAGTYTYGVTGPATATLTNGDIGMMSALGTTNVTTVNLTFTSTTSANYAWLTQSDSGSGTMTFSRVSNFVPASLAGKTVELKSSTGGGGPTLTYQAGGTFIRTQNGNTNWGNYTFTQYSPAVGIIQMNFTDPTEGGALSVRGIELHLSHRRWRIWLLLWQPDLRRQPR